MLVSSVWKAFYAEQLGNAFICCLPTDSYFDQLTALGVGWQKENAAPIAGEPTDYAIKASYINGFDVSAACDWPGPGHLQAFDAGVIRVTDSSSRAIYAPRVNTLPPSGKTFISGMTAAYIKPSTYHLPSVTISAGQTSVQYTAADYEACSRGNWFPQIWTQGNLGNVPARVTTAGSVVTVALSAALSFDVTFALSLYGAAN